MTRKSESPEQCPDCGFVRAIEKRASPCPVCAMDTSGKKEACRLIQREVLLRVVEMMDFRQWKGLPDCLAYREKLRECVHGLYGYQECGDCVFDEIGRWIALLEAVADRMERGRIDDELR